MLTSTRAGPCGARYRRSRRQCGISGLPRALRRRWRRTRRRSGRAVLGAPRRRPAPAAGSTPSSSPSWNRTITATTRSSDTGVSGATTVPAPNVISELARPSSEPPLQRRPHGDVARRQHHRARHRRAPLEVEDGERAVGEPQRREQRVVVAVRAVAGEVREVASADQRRGSGRRSASLAVRTPARRGARRARRPRRRRAPGRPGDERDPPAGSSRRRAMAQPVSDGLTDTARPSGPAGRPTAGRGARRSARRRRAAASARTRAREEPVGERAGHGRAVSAAAARDAAEPCARLSRCRLVAAAVDVGRQAVDRPQLVHDGPVADDRHGEQRAVEVGVLDRGPDRRAAAATRRGGTSAACRRPAPAARGRGSGAPAPPAPRRGRPRRLPSADAPPAAGWSTSRSSVSSSASTSSSGGRAAGSNDAVRRVASSWASSSRGRPSSIASRTPIRARPSLLAAAWARSSMAPSTAWWSARRRTPRLTARRASARLPRATRAGRGPAARTAGGRRRRPDRPGGELSSARSAPSRSPRPTRSSAAKQRRPATASHPVAERLELGGVGRELAGELRRRTVDRPRPQQHRAVPAPPTPDGRGGGTRRRCARRPRLAR